MCAAGARRGSRADILPLHYRKCLQLAADVTLALARPEADALWRTRGALAVGVLLDWWDTMATADKSLAGSWRANRDGHTAGPLRGAFLKWLERYLSGAYPAAQCA